MPFLDLDGRRLHYRASEHEDSVPANLPILIIHGAGGNGGAWRRVLEQLPGAFALDLPGRAGSDPLAEVSIPAYADVVRSAAQALARSEGAARVLVAGHSMGGAITIEAALAGSEEIAGIALLGTGGRLRVTRAILDWTAGLVPGADLTKFLAAGFAPGAPGDLATTLAEWVAESMVAMAHQDFRACNAWDRLADLGRIAQPALVLTGAADPLTPPKYAKFLSKSLPNSELEVLPDTGHMLEIEAPGAVAKRLAAFRASLAP